MLNEIDMFESSGGKEWMSLEEVEDFITDNNLLDILK